VKGRCSEFWHARDHIRQACVAGAIGTICQELPLRLEFSYLDVHARGMGTIRKTISLPEQIAKRLDKEAKRRKTSVSAIVTELVQQQQPARLPYAGLIDDDEQMSQDVEHILARLSS
jgi:hypothetical protein